MQESRQRIGPYVDYKGDSGRLGEVNTQCEMFKRKDHQDSVLDQVCWGEREESQE